VRKVYVYTQDTAENVSSTAGSAQIDFPLPTVLAMTGPSSIPQSGCSDAITIKETDSYGLSSPADTGGTALTLSGAGSGSFYSDAGCTTSATSATIAAGGNSIKVYYKSATTGSVALQASGLSTSATLNSSVDPVYLIEGGGGFTPCAIVSGDLQCWGNGDSGQVGTGTWGM
jgi:hypothetical protein